MGSRPHDSDKQANGCEALVGLVPHTEPTNKELVRQAGGIERVIAAMRTLPDDLDVQSQCSHALGRLAEGNHLNQQFITVSEGVRVVTTAMRTEQALAAFPGESVGVQKQGCRALGELAADQTTSGKSCPVDAGNQDEIRRLNGTGLIMAAIDVLREDDGTRAACCYALYRLAHENPVNRDEIRDLGGERVLTDAVQRNYDWEAHSYTEHWCEEALDDVRIIPSTPPPPSAEEESWCGDLCKEVWVAVVLIPIAEWLRKKLFQGCRKRGVCSTCTQVCLAEETAYNELDRGGLQLQRSESELQRSELLRLQSRQRHEATEQRHKREKEEANLAVAQALSNSQDTEEEERRRRLQHVHRAPQPEPEPEPEPAPRPALWEWKDDSGVWKPYTPEVCAKLEDGPHFSYVLRRTF